MATKRSCKRDRRHYVRGNKRSQLAINKSDYAEVVSWVARTSEDSFRAMLMVNWMNFTPQRWNNTLIDAKNVARRTSLNSCCVHPWEIHRSINALQKILRNEFACRFKGRLEVRSLRTMKT